MTGPPRTQWNHRQLPSTPPMPLLQDYSRHVEAVASVPEEDPPQLGKGSGGGGGGHVNARHRVPAVRPPPRPLADHQRSANDGNDRVRAVQAVAPTPQGIRMQQADKKAPALQAADRKPNNKRAPPAPSSGLKDADFGQLSIKGSRGFKFSLKSFTWGDTAVKVSWQWGFSMCSCRQALAACGCPVEC